MGGGSYSQEDRSYRTLTYSKQSRSETFSNRNIDPEMVPKGVLVREARDSDEHPTSIPIIICVDVTGSMGSIPHHLIQEGLPGIMEKIFEAGIEHPQLMFMAVGDHYTDSAPLQVGQFESSDELIDKWLEKIYLESGGGGNGGESYHLAWYFAAYHTSCDHIEKGRGRGILITIGDENIHRELEKNALQSISGIGENIKTYNSEELLEAAKENWNVFHIHMTTTQQGTYPGNQNAWKERLGDNLRMCGSKTEIATVISDIIVSTVDIEKEIVPKEVSETVTTNSKTNKSEVDIIL